MVRGVEEQTGTETGPRRLAAGADLVFVWGGDGMVQRCADVLAGTGATMAVVPAGTANLLATNLAIPKDVEGAVRGRTERATTATSTWGGSTASGSS